MPVRVAESSAPSQVS
ncbi:hypothetical protein CISIN_1g0467481mg, partial [Citrus sinensis]